MKKKTLALCLSIMLTLSMTACGSAQTETEKEKENTTKETTVDKTVDKKSKPEKAEDNKNSETAEKTDKKENAKSETSDKTSDKKAEANKSDKDKGSVQVNNSGSTNKPSGNSNSGSVNKPSKPAEKPVEKPSEPSKPVEKPVEKPSEPQKPAPHVCNFNIWKDEVSHTEMVTETYTEQVPKYKWIGYHECRKCGAQFEDSQFEDLLEHIFECDSTYTTKEKQVQDGFETVTKTRQVPKTVVDDPAHYECSCGKRK